MKQTLLILFATIFLTACGTTGPLDLTKLNEPIPTNKARIVVKRNNSLLYLAAAADVRSNGAKVASLGLGGSAIHDIPKGNNILSASTLGSFGRFTVTFDAKAGKIYNFEVSPRGKALLTASMWGVAGDTINANVSEQSGYFQIQLKDIQE